MTKICRTRCVCVFVGENVKVDERSDKEGGQVVTREKREEIAGEDPIYLFIYFFVRLKILYNITSKQNFHYSSSSLASRTAMQH